MITLETHLKTPVMSKATLKIWDTKSKPGQSFRTSEKRMVGCKNELF